MRKGRSATAKYQLENVKECLFPKQDKALYGLKINFPLDQAKHGNTQDAYPTEIKLTYHFRSDFEFCLRIFH